MDNLFSLIEHFPNETKIIVTTPTQAIEKTVGLIKCCSDEDFLRAKVEDWSLSKKGTLCCTIKRDLKDFKNEDVILIHTNGLEEGIRCALCKNPIKSDRGCDGNCNVDTTLLSRICNLIEHQKVY